MGEFNRSWNLEDVSKYLEDLPMWGKTIIAGGVALAFYLPYSWYRSHSRGSPIKEDYKQGVVYVYQFPRTKNIPSISSSCLKLETWIRMANIPYENVRTPLSVRGLDGGMPFIEVNGKEISHSSFAIRALRTKFEKEILDEHLSDEQKSACHSFERLVEFSLHASHLIYRTENADKVIGLIPSSTFGIFAPLSSIFEHRAYIGKCASALSASDIGRFSRTERIEQGKDDLRALSKYLGAKHYFTGFKPTSVDATIFGTLAQIAYSPYDSEHKDVLKGECSNLIQDEGALLARLGRDYNNLLSQFKLEKEVRKPFRIRKAISAYIEKSYLKETPF